MNILTSRRVTCGEIKNIFNSRLKGTVPVTEQSLFAVRPAWVQSNQRTLDEYEIDVR